MSKQIGNIPISFFSLRGRDIFWNLSLAIIVNLVAITLLSLGHQSMLMPLLVMVGLVNLFGLFMAIDAADDFSAMIQDLDSSEKESNLGKRLTNTPIIMFKIAFSVLHIGMAGSILFTAF